MHIDMTAPDATLKPGVDLWKVRSAEETKSKKGSLMLVLKLARVHEPASGLLWDRLMLEGAGLQISRPKLIALGIPENFKGELQASQLVDREVWIKTVIESYEGQDRLKVDPGSLSHKGYQAATNPPAGFEAPAAPDPVSDMPF